jgi:hypothetical protein
MVMILERIIMVINEKKIDNNLYIYQCLNGNHEWKDEYELILCQSKNSINQGNWKCIDEIEDILILSEMLYDWLDDNVYYIICTTHLDFIFKNEFEAELQRMIAYRGEYTIDTRKLIIDKFKNELKMDEFECLSCFAHFLSNLLPESIDDVFTLNEFNLVFDKISIYLLGYTIEMVYENEDAEQAQTCQNYVSRLKDMLHFFAIIIRYDWCEPIGRKGSTNVMSNYLKRYYNHEDDTVMVKRREQSFKRQKNIEEIINSNTNKDEFLMNMYKALHEYFNKDKIESKMLNGRKPSGDIDNFNDFFLSFIDFIESVKKKENALPEEEMKDSVATIHKNNLKKDSEKSKYSTTTKLIQFAEPVSIMDTNELKKDSSTYALVLKDDKGYEVDDSPEKLLHFQPNTSKYKTDVIRRLQVALKIDSSLNVIQILNGTSKNSKGINLNFNTKPKSRRTDQFKKHHIM